MREVFDMLKKIGLSIIFIFLFTAGTSFAGDLESYWTNQEFKIDGQLDEWGDHSLNHFEDEKFSVGIRNDSNYMYLMFVTRDQYMVRMAQMSGLKVWINGKGKKDKKFGLLYYPDFGSDSLLFKMPQRPAMNGGPQPEGDMPDRAQQRRQMLGRRFVVDEEGGQSEKDSRLNYTKFNSGIYKGVYLVEMRFALKGDDLLGDYLSVKPKDKISVCFELGNDMQNQRKDMRGAPPGGGMRGGGGGDDFGGGPPGGGMGGGPPGGGRPGGMGGQRPEMVNLDKWVKIKLAENK